MENIVQKIAKPQTDWLVTNIIKNIASKESLFNLFTQIQLNGHLLENKNN